MGCAERLPMKTLDAHLFPLAMTIFLAAWAPAQEAPPPLHREAPSPSERHLIGEEPQPREEPEVVVDRFGTVDLVVQDTEVTQVLEMLAIQSHKNIIASQGVIGGVSANLYDVTFHEALDAILRVNGFGFIEEGNFVYVYTAEELEHIEAARRRTDSRIYGLEYLSAADADEFVQPLLSEAGMTAYRGSVEPGYAPTITDGGADSFAWASKLVVTDFPENLDRIGELLDELDTAPRQVVVEATIVSTTVNEDNQFGVDFSALSNIDIGGITGGPMAAANDLVSGALGATNSVATTMDMGGTGDATQAGLLKVGVLRDHVGAFLKVLDQVSDTTVVARPRLTCLNRQKSEVLIGVRRGYLSSTVTQTSTTQTVEFLDTGVHLVLRPFISPDNMIRLELYPSLSSATFRTDGTQQVPDETTHEVRTNVRCKDGETIVLGGLFKEQTTMTRRQVPFLGDIPVLGAAFRGQDDAIIKEEVIFLLTPTIVQDERLWEAGRDSLELADAVRIGARAGLLPFSRDQITANYNRDAIDAYRRGRLDEALYWTNLSLRTSGVQPEMIRLRDRIADEEGSAWEEDIVRDLLLNEVQQLQISLQETSE
jgi:type IV pilus assembly protein PilQ